MDAAVTAIAAAAQAPPPRPIHVIFIWRSWPKIQDAEVPARQKRHAELTWCLLHRELLQSRLHAVNFVHLNGQESSEAL